MFHPTIPDWLRHPCSSWRDAQLRQADLITEWRLTPTTPHWWNGYAETVDQFVEAYDTRNVPAPRPTHHARPAVAEPVADAETTATMPPIVEGPRCGFKGHEPGDPNRATCPDCASNTDVIRHYSAAKDNPTELDTLVWKRPVGGYTVHARSVLAELRAETPAPAEVVVVAEQAAWVPAVAALMESAPALGLEPVIDLEADLEPTPGAILEPETAAELEPVLELESPTSLETDSLVAQWLAEIDQDHRLRVRASELEHRLAIESGELVSA